MKRGALAAVAGAVVIAAAVLVARERDPVKRGEALASGGKIGKALAVWRDACADGVARACAAAGARHLSTGAVDKAREMSARADAIDASALEPMLLRAGIALVDGDREAARDVYEEAETKHPYSGLPAANLAMMALEDGDLDGAQAAVDRALHSNRDLAMGWAVRGRILVALGDPAGAESAYRAALLLDPSPHVKLELADVLSMVDGDAAERERLLAEAVRALPRDVDARIAWGQALSHAGRREAAVEVLREAAELAPDRVEPLLYLGEVFLDQGRPEFAEARLRKALELEPTSVDVAGLLSEALVSQGKHEEAIAALDAVMAREDVAPEVSEELRMSRARIQAERGAHALARKDLEAVLARSPDRVDALLLHGHLLIEEGRHAEARRHVEKALALDPESALAVFAHARILAAAGQHDAALAELQALAALTTIRPQELKAQPEFAPLANRREFRLLLEGASESPPPAPTP